uniref:ERV/ALR sulfhydryl oxidase domain-containing protein n=1 Tax=viral metagenome TaxID=1070528 RepID=A0A6C0BRN0_9ZZZZ
MTEIELNKGLSILVAAYPARPNKAQRTAMYNFLTYFSRVIQHEDLPAWYQQYTTSRMSPNIVRNRQFLTQWLMSVNRFRLWFNAIDLVDDPKLWGPIIWNFLYILASLFFPHRAIFFHRIIMLLPDVLPCKVCGEKLRCLLQGRRWQEKLLRCRTQVKYVNFITDLRTYVATHHVTKEGLTKNNLGFKNKNVTTPTSFLKSTTSP